MRTYVISSASTDEPFSINLDNEIIKNSNNKKLLGMITDWVLIPM